MSYSWTPQAPSLNQHKAALTGPLTPLSDGTLATTIDQATTIAAGSDGAALPQATINVASTTTFAASGTITVVTDGGNQTVTYTGKNGTQFTGCAGGSGTMSTGGAVTQVKALPQATLYVADTTGFLAAGTALVTSSDGVQSVTYTGKTGTTLTGCSGGTGNIADGDAVEQGNQVYLNKTFLGWSPELFPVIIIQCAAAATVDVLGLDDVTWCQYPGASDSCGAGAMKVLRGRWKALRVTTLGAVYVKGDLDWAAYNAAL